ncbi:hypothetical protein WN51_10234 [Melipona quadrifasciata]|uniref:Uncharacterized protein n=1 Tax=Melipona quadrifasciata TaxID=166423 RepID=A0A0N0U675_9HYME|nr:hypothetical protein WN51_10234 [Melipona quadrifasciata]
MTWYLKSDVYIFYQYSILFQFYIKRENLRFRDIVTNFTNVFLLLIELKNSKAARRLTLEPPTIKEIKVQKLRSRMILDSDYDSNFLNLQALKTAKSLKVLILNELEIRILLIHLLPRVTIPLNLKKEKNQNLCTFKVQKFYTLRDRSVPDNATPPRESRDPNQPIANFRCISVAPAPSVIEYIINFPPMPHLKLQDNSARLILSELEYHPIVTSSVLPIAVECPQIQGTFGPKTRCVRRSWFSSAMLHVCFRKLANRETKEVEKSSYRQAQPVVFRLNQHERIIRRDFLKLENLGSLWGNPIAKIQKFTRLDDDLTGAFGPKHCKISVFHFDRDLRNKSGQYYSIDSCALTYDFIGVKDYLLEENFIAKASYSVPRLTIEYKFTPQKCEE